MIPAHKSGSLAEMKAATYMIEEGYDVFFPITMNPKTDFVAIKDGEVIRVQVKKASWSKSGNYNYLQCRLLGKDNGSSQRVYKMNDFDELIIIEGSWVWRVPVKDIIGRTSLCLDTDNPNPKLTNKGYNPRDWLVRL